MRPVALPSEPLHRLQRLNGTGQCRDLDTTKSCSQERLDCLIDASESTWRCRHPGAPAVIGSTRLYCNQGEEFLLIDIATEDASKRAEELANDGWEIEAAIPV